MWLLGEGVGFMHCCRGHASCWGCMVAGGHVWLPGGMRGCQGVCGCLGDMHGCGGHAWLQGEGVHRARRDTVNELAVPILLECILV